MSFEKHVPVLWSPTETQQQHTQIHQFAKRVGIAPQNYADLHRYSIANIDDFWEQFIDFSGLIYEGSWQQVVEKRTSMAETRFFHGMKLNLAENMLAGEGADILVIEANEYGQQAVYTRAEIRLMVAQLQRSLKGMGIQAEDRVVGLLPNNVEALVSMLAVTSLGAIWSTCSPEFGVTGITDRFGQVEPKVLMGCTEYLYNGTHHNMLDKLQDVLAVLPSVELLIVVGEGDVPEMSHVQVQRFTELLNNTAVEPVYERYPFDHPVFIVYTSGTTGLPKCIVHRTGGILVNLKKEHALHCDVRQGDRMLYYTNTAWMMYHWLVLSMASGASVVLYDGAAIPKTPNGLHYDVLWELAAELKVSHFGTSPKYLSLLEEAGRSPTQQLDLTSIRVVASAGAPLTPENFSWLYQNIHHDMCVASISGGTEILGCFVMGNPSQAVRAGEIQGPALGMAVHVFDERNVSVLGQKGELVCTEAFPSMPLTFWGQNGDARFYDEYFADVPGVWVHGDLAEVRASGGVMIYGRTDTTLKPGGVRIGTGEIYRILEVMDEIQDALVIGYPVHDDMEIWLFVLCAESVSLDDGLRKRIVDELRHKGSPRHVPRRIIEVADIPYTLSGKKVEKAVLQKLLGKAVTNVGSLSNPEALDSIQRSVEEQSEVKS
ncbi:acetoacetate--CoA ligase [Alcaligenes sp. AB3]|uniref:acetoacetate--CoA ligase n=1 Tax=Alcaligenes sp. AB3 TaxID=2962569 RepID=UPI002882555C|nr:acetoacetate--CoA ligase [Alcaligenes sp. AB3]MDT0217416.1 acetoacetate--CoA ligase [Alcaligenes sp. AB3]